MAKSEMPRAKLPSEGKRRRVARFTTMMQVMATAINDVLYDGRENMEE